MNVLGSKSAPPYITFGGCADLKSTDSFLLCSDGLWHYFTDEELAATISVHSPRTGSETLISKARERAYGKGDNCTLAIIKLVDVVEKEKEYVVGKMRRAV